MIPNHSVIVSPSEPTGNSRKKVWMQKGKNLFNAYTVAFADTRCTHSIENSNKIILAAAGQWAKTLCRVSNLKPNEAYTIKTKITNSNLNKVGLFENDNNFVINSAETFNSKIVMNSDSEGYLEFTIWINWSDTSNTNSATFDEIQLEQGSVATDYEKYIEPKIYIKNGNDVYEEFMKKEEKNIITASLLSTKAFTSSEKYQLIIIPLSVESNIGSKFAITDDGGIKIGKGMKNIKVSANLGMTGVVNHHFGIGVYKNTTKIKGAFLVKDGTAGYSFSTSISNIIVPVVEGDVIYLKLYIEDSGDTANARTGETYMTIEAID